MAEIMGSKVPCSGLGVFRFVQGTMYPIVHALALKYFPYGYFKAQVYTR